LNKYIGLLSTLIDELFRDILDLRKHDAGVSSCALIKRKLDDDELRKYRKERGKE